MMSKPLLSHNYKLCYFLSLKVNGRWAEWTDWGVCSVSCGGGVHLRGRECIGPFHGGAHCRGPDEDQQTCNDDIICTGMHTVHVHVHVTVCHLHNYLYLESKYIYFLGACRLLILFFLNCTQNCVIL